MATPTRLLWSRVLLHLRKSRVREQLDRSVKIDYRWIRGLTRDIGHDDCDVDPWITIKSESILKYSSNVHIGRSEASSDYPGGNVTN